MAAVIHPAPGVAPNADRHRARSPFKSLFKKLISSFSESTTEQQQHPSTIIKMRTVHQRSKTHGMTFSIGSSPDRTATAKNSFGRAGSSISEYHSAHPKPKSTSNVFTQDSEEQFQCFVDPESQGKLKKSTSSGSVSSMRKQSRASSVNSVTQTMRSDDHVNEDQKEGPSIPEGRVVVFTHDETRSELISTMLGSKSVNVRIGRDLSSDRKRTISKESLILEDSDEEEEEEEEEKRKCSFHSRLSGSWLDHKLVEDEEEQVAKVVADDDGESEDISGSEDEIL